MKVLYDINLIRDKAKLSRDKYLEYCELLRISELKKSITILKQFLKSYPDLHMYLFGSITQSGQFTKNSDIDIAIDNFKGSRLDIYLELEELFSRKIDLIILEKCTFRDDIVNRGIKIQ